MSRSTCPKCGGRMEQGFIPDATDNTTKVTNWVEGAPVKRWYGLKTRGLRKLTVETWRCGRCGFLECYAPGA